MNRLLGWIALVVAVMLAGCGGSATRPADAPLAQQQQTSADAARSRAKVHTELGMAYLSGNQLTIALDEARVAINTDSSYAQIGRASCRERVCQYV